MAGDVKYQVIVEYATKGSLASELPQMTGGANALGGALARTRGEAKSLGTSLSDVGSAFRNAGSAIADSFTSAVERVGDFAKGIALAGAAAGIGAVTYGVMHLNTELEQANLSLAAMFNAQGYTNSFADAMKLSGDQVSRMKDEVKQLPGTFMELTGIMQSIAIPAAQAGLTPTGIRKLAEQAMLFGGVQGMRPDEAGAGLSMLLSGVARNTSPMARLLGFTGAAGTKLRAESGAERYKDIEKALAKYDAATEAFSHTWKAVSTTVKDDILLSLLSPATSPLFESIKKTLVSIHGWFDGNRGQIANFTHILGEGLASAWERGTRIFNEWLPAVTSFARDAYNEIAGIWERVEPTISRIANAIRESLGDGTALKRIEEVVKLYAAVKGGGAIAGMVSPFASPLLSTVFGGGGAAGAESAAGGAAAGASGLAVAGGILGLGAITAVTIASVGQVIAMGDAYSPEHERAIGAAKKLDDALRDTAGDMKGKFDGHGMERFGVAVTGATGSFLEWMHEGNDFFKRLAQGGWTFSPTPGVEHSVDLAVGDRSSPLHLRTRAHPWKFQGQEGIPGAGDKLADPNADKAKAPVNLNVTNNNYFTISSNHDPSRIARDVVSHIADARRYRVQSPFVRQPSGVTG